MDQNHYPTDPDPNYAFQNRVRIIYRYVIIPCVKANNFAIDSVIQTDGNSFCGVVVLDSFKKASRDEDNILDQIIKCSDFYYDNFKLS